MKISTVKRGMRIKNPVTGKVGVISKKTKGSKWQIDFPNQSHSLYEGDIKRYFHEAS